VPQAFGNLEKLPVRGSRFAPIDRHINALRLQLEPYEQYSLGLDGPGWLHEMPSPTGKRSRQQAADGQTGREFGRRSGARRTEEPTLSLPSSGGNRPRRRYADSSTRWSQQSFIEHNSSPDQAEDDRCGQQQPAPILGWMAQSTDKMAPIVICDDCDAGVTCTSADDHDCQKSPDTVVRGTCGCEKHACGHWNRYCRRDRKSTGAPFLKEIENSIQFPMRELAV